MVPESPNAKYDHIYAIIRLERDVITGELLDRNLVTIKKLVRSRENAEQEVDRLNKLNSDKGCDYYFQITRLEREPKEQIEKSN
ncbi:MAG: hypothetical protein ACO3GX_16885 [Gemmataceae bacterium]|jgi:hypothetical protein|nr:hypothetical protein [Planctomycetota bacterium]